MKAKGYLPDVHEHPKRSKVAQTLYSAVLNHSVQTSPFLYRGYYYDVDLNLYVTGTRYYDPTTGRFINADDSSVITATPEALTDKNLYAYCDNNPVMRVDHSGEWWLFANAIVGAIVGAITKIACNVATNKELNDGVVGAAVGGAAYGVTLAQSGSVSLAGYVGAAAESITNEVSSYIPIVSSANNRDLSELSEENINSSLTTIVKDTLITGTMNAVTGTVASRLVPTNNGWFTPKKFIGSFVGKYAQKAHLQTLSQGLVTFGFYCLHRKGLESIR